MIIVMISCSTCFILSIPSININTNPVIKNDRVKTNNVPLSFVIVFLVLYIYNAISDIMKNIPVPIPVNL